jgi:hypothetical protein
MISKTEKVGWWTVFSSKKVTKMCIDICSQYERGLQMFPIFNGPIACFVRKHKLVRRTVLLGGVVVGVYYAGVGLGWWPNILG